MAQCSSHSMDPRTTTWPTYKWPRNIDNLNTPWVPSPDSFTGALPDAHNTVQARLAPQQSYEPPKTVIGRKIGTLMRVLCLLKREYCFTSTCSISTTDRSFYSSSTGGTAKGTGLPTSGMGYSQIRRGPAVQMACIWSVLASCRQPCGSA